MKRKIAVALTALGVLALSIFIATALDRIKQLEKAVARLEKTATPVSKDHPDRIAQAEFTPDGKAIRTYDDNSLRIWQVPSAGKPVTIAPLPNQPSQELPPGWQPHEFNGMTYYVVPLAHPSGTRVALAK